MGYKILGVEGITREVRINGDYKILLCTFGLNIFLFPKIGCTAERPGFKDLGHGFFILDESLSFPNSVGKQTDGYTNLDHYGVKCKYESH